MRGAAEKSVLEKMVQKDAQGPISPLRVRIGRVWALGAQFDPVFGVFCFSKKFGSRKVLGHEELTKRKKFKKSFCQYYTPKRFVNS